MRKEKELDNHTIVNLNCRIVGEFYFFFISFVKCLSLVMVSYRLLTTVDVQQVIFNFTRQLNALTGSPACIPKFQTSALLASSGSGPGHMVL